MRAALIGAIRGDEGPPVLNTAQPGSRRHGLLDPSTRRPVDPSILTIGTSMLGALTEIGAAAGVVWVGGNLAYKAM